MKGKREHLHYFGIHSVHNNMKDTKFNSIWIWLFDYIMINQYEVDGLM
jgi:hypothetical protein